MKYKATKRFKELGIDNSYHGLETWQYFDLRAGEVIEIKNVPIKLIEGKYLEEAKGVKPEMKGK